LERLTAKVIGLKPQTNKKILKTRYLRLKPGFAEHFAKPGKNPEVLTRVGIDVTTADCIQAKTACRLA
jgi:predicted methyltransferase